MHFVHLNYVIGNHEVINLIEPIMDKNVQEEEKSKTDSVKLLLGPRLGSGANKYAYALKEDPTKCALVSSLNVLKSEREDLEKLEKAGVPVPKVYELHDSVTADKNIGQHESALIVERFACGSRGDVQSKLLDVLSEKSIDSIKEIKNKLLAAELYVDDLQFLFREDGTMVLADPDHVSKIETNQQKKLLNISMTVAINKITLGLEYARDVKEGVAPKPDDNDSYAFWAAAEKWHRESAEPKAARKAHIDGIYTQTRVMVVDNDVFDDVDAAV